MPHSELEALAKQLLSPLHAIKLDAEYNENLFAVAQAKQALDMVESAILLRRLESRQAQLELEPMHIGDIVNKVVMSLRDFLTEQNIDYELDFHKGTPAITADRLIIEQAVKMLFYGTHYFNINGTVLRLKTSKAKNGTVVLSLVAPELASDRVILHTKQQASANAMTPIEISRSLFAMVGGTMQKTHTSSAKGFCVSLPSSQQLTLV